MKEAATAGQALCILLIEDSAADAGILREALADVEGARFRIDWMKGLAEGAARAAEDERVDVVVLDLTLPESDGIETFRAARALMPDLPIVVLTGLRDEAIAVTALSEGAQDYLVKGRVDPDTLARSLRYAIERKRAEEQLRRLNEDLEEQRLREQEHRAEDELRRRDEQLASRLRQAERLESLGRLAGGIAHDFNNLLSVILNCAAFVAREIAPGAPACEDVEEIRRAAERAAELTHQLLLFSRREAVQPVVLNLNEVVEDTEKLLRRTLGEDITFSTTLLPGLWSVEADPGQVEQVLLNLAINARDAMRDGGDLIISTANVDLAPLPEGFPDTEVAPGPYVQIVVTDTGEGMDREMTARAFEPFFTTKPTGRGTGLGLATVYGIVAQAGGYATIYSEPGHGTAVKVYLPAVGRAPARRERTAPPAPPRARGETILLVEDEDSVRKVVRRILAESGYTVIEVPRPSEIFESWKEHAGSIELLLTDVVMPDTSGKELAERLRERIPGLKVLYMSGYTYDVVARQGALDAPVLEKPFTEEELLARVRAILDDPSPRPGA